MWKLFVCVVLCALALENCQAQLNNPCPDRFSYETTNEKGRWVGTLNLVSDHKLYGTWIRLIFDAPIKGVEVAGGLLTPDTNASSETHVVLKNWNQILKKGVPTIVTFAVHYDAGLKFPNLIGYRINGRQVCPESDD